MFRTIATALLCVALTGCATINEMAFDKTSTAIDTREKSVVLMTVEVFRPDESRFVPEPMVTRFEKPGAQSRDERQNFKLDKDKDAVQEKGRTVYLARMALPPGQYKLQDIFGMARAFPINGMFSVPLAMDVQVAPNSVVYLGRVRATLRPRVGEEFRAGPLLPLIDQSVAGMSGSTWDVATENLVDTDLALFRTQYPVLNSVKVDTAILPAFDRAAAQRFWDGESKQSAPAATAKN